ncbi:BTB/POZ domain-containing protein 6-B-like [Brevipalpus obovatus]|uniref:BTB/POZ domain-containing protein 6-B-like n=1 Tax=Brevipalpus obovatus TaxID=246614 RepID=UPI003D9DE1FE
MSSLDRSSASSSENETFDQLESPAEDSVTYKDHEMEVEETESWPGNLKENVRCLVENDEDQTLKGRLAKYLLNEDVADVHFLVTKDDKKVYERVPAHKFILAAGSCVFKAMFYGSLSNPGHNEIHLSDIEYSALLNLLKYLYLDEADISPSNLVATLYAAKKYQVVNLEKVCVNYLSWSLSSENVLLVLSQAILFDEKYLVERCWSKIEENITDVIEASTFESTDYNTLVLLLERNGLALKEIDLFKAVIRWAEAECKRRDIPNTPNNLRLALGDALYLIRFPTMSGQDFLEVCSLGLLKDIERTSVFSFFAYNTKEGSTSDNLKPIFSNQPRSSPIKNDFYKLTKEIVLSRFEKSASGRFCMFDEIHKVDFIVDHPIHITGLGVYGTRCQKGERMIYIELRHSETGEILANGHSKITCTGKPKIYQVRFRSPPVIAPTTIYTASAEFDGNYPYPTFYGINGRRICLVELPIENTEEENEEEGVWLNFRGDPNSQAFPQKTRPEKAKTKKITFIFFKSEKGNFLDTGGEKGQIPQIMFHA